MINEVILSLVIIWGGIALFLYRLDRRITTLEGKIDEL